jgi:hypothetical protein
MDPHIDRAEGGHEAICLLVGSHFLVTAGVQHHETWLMGV